MLSLDLYNSCCPLQQPPPQQVTVLAPTLIRCNTISKPLLWWRLLIAVSRLVQQLQPPAAATTTTIAVSAAIADVARAATAAVAQATEQFPLELDTVFLNTNIRLTMNLVICLCKIPGSDAHAKLWFLFGNHLSWFSNGSHAMNFEENYARIIIMYSKNQN